jgi:competence protein ComEC
VLARYAARDIQVISTPQCGALRWHTLQPRQLHCERDEQRRYWQHRGSTGDPTAPPA